MKYFIRIFLILLLLAANMANGQSDPYYTTARSFGLSIMPEKKGLGEYRHSVITFLPRSFLLFIDDRNMVTKNIYGQRYIKVKSQDGVQLWVLEATVSKSTAKQKFKNASVHFNTTTVVCRIEQCDSSIDDHTYEIWGSEVLEVDENYESSTWFKLNWIRNGSAFTGYIRKSKLKKLNDEGSITFSNEQHPKYTIEVSKNFKASKKCGDIYNYGESKTFGRKLALWEKELIVQAGIGTVTVDGLRINFERLVGNKEELHYFRTYKITDNDSGQTYSLVAQIQYACKLDGGLTVLQKIKNVNLIQEGEIEYNLSDFDVALELSNELQTPDYLWSINTRVHYFELLKRLSETLKNRALAGYFLSEFNRSCPSNLRGSLKCRKHDYGK
ncbi:hypothetical protein [Pseudoalteromonas sp. MMG005]|uniref:hypothetical protein n=1 Tax=Pseudoalteromonas sp. MMG005 TaxID=2822682 RepID=UPI001B39EC1E|nr:hypothetical protein [Pseudoalteromonas sp. MMG005]MBQ4845548.1 hypothetical protein [Pseudoalteromonas sp. MMG005]